MGENNGSRYWAMSGFFVFLCSVCSSFYLLYFFYKKIYLTFPFVGDEDGGVWVCNNYCRTCAEGCFWG